MAWLLMLCSLTGLKCRLEAMTQHIKLEFEARAPEEVQTRSLEFFKSIKTRRTVRDFADTPVPKEVIKNAILAAGTAPNGANLQPWHFVAVSNPSIKHRIREAAETEEHEFYASRAPQEWLEALAPLGTDANKPFLEIAPYLIVIFGQAYGVKPDGSKFKHYYVPESVGIATGFLIAALHSAGLATLTHTPSPMAFLSEILERPANERAFLILVVGYPAENAVVPVIEKKSLTELATFLE